jgi:signal transduction histidine kinase
VSGASADRAELAAALAARLVPVLVILGAVVSLAAPLAYHWMGARELREAGAQAALQVAEILAREAEERPVLWAYDSIKLVEHLRAYRDRPHVARVEVADARGRPIDPAFEPIEERLLWAAAPIAVRGRRIGEVWVGMDPAPLRARSLTLLALFTLLGIGLAALAYAVATRSARAAEARIGELVERLSRAQAEERVRALARRAIVMQEKERRAIARDLHDGVGQALVAIRIHSDLLGAKAASPDDVTRLSAQIGSMADSTLEEIRRTIARLGPAVLDEVGLRAAIDRLLDDLVEHAGLRAERYAEGVDDLPEAVETAIYRIVQEALTNVARHARARHVWVRIAREQDEVAIEVEDDGVGPGGPNGAAREDARGIAGMRERAELLGGRLEVEPREGGGTRVRARLRVDPE